MMANRRSLLWVVFGLSLFFHAVVLGYIFRFTPEHVLPIDDWVSSLPVARAAVTGANPLPSILTPVNYIHMHIPTHTTTYLLVTLTGWNPLAGALLNYGLAVCNLALFLLLYTRIDRSLFVYLLLPLTALLLAPQQEANWVASLHNSRHFLPLFMLLALLAVTRDGKAWLNLLLAALAAAAASLTLLDGMVTWVVILVALPLLGYRKPAQYLFWGALTVVAVLIYLNLPGIDPGNGALLEGEERLVNFEQLGAYLVYVLVFIGGVFGAGPDHANFLTLLLMSVLGLLMWAWNSVYLLRHTHARQSVVVSGLMMLFVLGAGALNAIGRVNTFGVRWGAATHYIAAGLLFWGALSVLVVLVLRDVFVQGAVARRRNLVLGNALLVTLAVVLYLLAAVAAFRVADDGQARIEAIELCLESVAGGADLPGCEVNGGLAERTLILELAEMELAGFR